MESFAQGTELDILTGLDKIEEEQFRTNFQAMVSAIIIGQPNPLLAEDTED